MNIIVTGASKGIGLEVCRQFLNNENNSVIALSRSIGSLNNEDFLDNNRFLYIKSDITSINSIVSILPDIEQFLGKIDILINNAGLLINKPFDELTDEDFDATFNVNTKGPFRLIRELVPMFNSGSHIVNITSMGGYQGSSKFPGLSLYSASKAALGILTECIAEEFKERNIYSNALALGAVQTEMLSQAFHGYRAPLQPHEMANFICDFAIVGSRFFNGKILPVSLSTP